MYCTTTSLARWDDRRRLRVLLGGAEFELRPGIERRRRRKSWFGPSESPLSAFLGHFPAPSLLLGVRNSTYVRRLKMYFYHFVTSWAPAWPEEAERQAPPPCQRCLAEPCSHFLAMNSRTLLLTLALSSTHPHSNTLSRSRKLSHSLMLTRPHSLAG